MHPSKLTEAFSAYNTPSEKLVYDKFSRELSDKYHVFHDFMWDDPSLDENKTEGQIDFVIVNPDYGYITIEVKGGRCDYDHLQDAWLSIDKSDKEYDIKNPFYQARTASRIIMKLLLKNKATQNIYLPHHHAVVFPDCNFEKKDLSANLKKWQIIDRDSLYNLEKTIETLFENAFPKTEKDSVQGSKILSGFNNLYGCLSLIGHDPTITRIREISDRLLILTEQQSRILKSLSTNQRQLIRGCAGSGKTMLAIHKAKMLADQNKKVLLLCYNIPLCQFLKRECLEYSNITVGSFHNLCKEWLDEIDHSATETDSADWYAETLPNLVADNLEEIKHRFDAIIVDEGQDFKETYWLLLEMLFKNTGDNIFYIFTDSNQNIYEGTEVLPMTSSEYTLNQNIRNTNQVFNSMKKLNLLNDDIYPSGIDGPKVQFYAYNDEEEMASIIKDILGKLTKEHITAQDVVLLGTKSQKRTNILKYGNKIGPFTLVENTSSNREIKTMTTKRFKGLEKSVVIICELDEDKYLDISKSLYIGMTRSTGMLFILRNKKISLK